MPQESKKIKDFSKLSFEDAMEKLENTVKSMEDGNIKLEEMIQKFEEGRMLAAVCQKKLDSLKGKVELLTKENNHDAVWKDIDTDGITESKNDFIPAEKEIDEEDSDADSGEQDLLF